MKHFERMWIANTPFLDQGANMYSFTFIIMLSMFKKSTKLSRYMKAKTKDYAAAPYWVYQDICTAWHPKLSDIASESNRRQSVVFINAMAYKLLEFYHHPLLLPYTTSLKLLTPPDSTCSKGVSYHAFKPRTPSLNRH